MVFILRFRNLVFQEYTMSSVASISTSVKIVGTNGQISLGKQFAGRQVLIEEQSAGVPSDAAAGKILKRLANSK